MWASVTAGVDFYTLSSGLPNALGGYDETPEIMARHLKVRNVFCCVYSQ